MTNLEQTRRNIEIVLDLTVRLYETRRTATTPIDRNDDLKLLGDCATDAHSLLAELQAPSVTH